MTLSRQTVASFVFDDANEAKFAAHGVSARQVDDVLDEQYIIVANRAKRSATHLIIGRDGNGTCLAIPVLQTNEPGVWRPLTAWRCKDSEKARLEQAVSKRKR